MIPIGGTAVAVASAYMMYEYLRQPPLEAYIAASTDKKLKMKLHCLPNHKREELSKFFDFFCKIQITWSQSYARIYCVIL